MQRAIIAVIVFIAYFSSFMSCKKKDNPEPNIYNSSNLQGIWDIQRARYQYYKSDSLVKDTSFYGPMPDSTFVEMGPSFFRRISFSGDQMIVTSSGIGLEKDTFQYTVGYEYLMVKAAGTSGQYTNSIPIYLSDTSLTLDIKIEMGKPQDYLSAICNYQRAKQ